jgi:hypothetical protein
MMCCHGCFCQKEKSKFMFNKIVASVISSVVLFACNVKDDVVATPAAEDVVSSVEQAAPAAPAVTDDKSVNASAPVVAPVAPVATPVVSGEVAGGASVPLAAPSTGVGVTSTVTSTPATSVSPVAAPATATVTK